MSAVDSVAVVFDSGSVTEQATLPVDVRSYSELLAFVRQAFKQPQLVGASSCTQWRLTGHV